MFRLSHPSGFMATFNAKEKIFSFEAKEGTWTFAANAGVWEFTAKDITYDY
jgi:hypothetical protein